MEKEEFDVLLDLIFEYIKIIPEEKYEKLYEKLKVNIKDIKDLPYFAVCLLINAEGIWTHDPHFLDQNKFKILKNIDMLKISGKSNK